MSRQLTENQAKCLKVIEKVQFVNLSTIDKDGFPSTRLMMNLRDKTQFSSVALYEQEENPLVVYLTANAFSEKMAEIRNNPKAGLYFYDATSFSSVLLQGNIEIVADEALRKNAWQQDWSKHYPNGENEYALLRFIPSKMKASINVSSIAENI